jgi:hypothetical protein
MPFFKVVGNRVDITSPENTTQFKALHLSIQNLQKQVSLKKHHFFATNSIETVF